MNTIVIPGYGDTDGYIQLATKNWDKRYSLQTEIHKFGWDGEAGTYDEKWADFEQKLQSLGETAIIGISAGASVAVRALQEYPGLVSKVVTICGPMDASKMNPDTLHNKYPILEQSLEHVPLGSFPRERIMTMRPYYDDVVSVGAMVVPGAHDKRVHTVGHAFSIGWTMFTKGKALASFINQNGV